MDKLKPVLAQKFWIFFGLVLIMPVAGYFMTKGDLAAQIDERWKKLNTTFTDIPAGTDSPNESWSKGLNDLNSQQELLNGQANDALWKAQAAKMRWPREIAAAMQQCEYFKSLSPERGGGQVPFKYRLNYTREIRRLWEIVDPLDDAKNLRDSNARRKVVFAMSELQQVNPAKWEVFAPEFEELWACQEDIWLQTELLSAVARVNANYQSQLDAPIKQLGKTTLFGGTTVKGDAAAGPATGGPSMADGGIGSMMGAPRKTETATSVDIPLAEEFIMSLDQGGGAAAPGFGGGFGGDGGSPGKDLGGGGPTAAKSDVKRYLDDDDKLPFKLRGFYIKLVMDHRKVPELLAELMNSPFPVEIIRVHQTWYSDAGAGGAAGGGGPMAGLSGASGPPKGFGTFGASEGLAPPTSSGDDPSTATTGTSGPRPGISIAASQAAMSDPNLASVAILGVWTLYRPPVIDPTKPAPASAPDAAAGLATTAPTEAVSPSEPTTNDPSDAKEAAPTKAAEDADSKDPAEPKTDATEKETPDKPATEPSEKPAAEPKAE